MRRLAKQTVTLLALGLSAVAAAPALAQDAAEGLFNRGVEDLKAGRHAAACPAIAESQRLDPRPGTLFTLATCEEGWGHVATAARLYADYLALYEALPPERQAAQRQSGRPTVAAERREQLAAQIPALALSLPPGAPAGTVVKRDGQEVPAAALGAAIGVEPGAHVVSTQAPGGPLWEQTLTLARGEKRAVVLEVSPAVAPAPLGTSPPLPPPVVPAEGPGGRRLAGFVLGGAGLAGMAAAAVLGGLVLARKSTLTAHCGAGIHATDDGACDPTGLAAARSGKSLALGSSIALPVGVAALGAGLALVLSAPVPATPVAPARVGVGVLSLGPDGALLGLRGAW
jgi:hypothetical protein